MHATVILRWLPVLLLPAAALCGEGREPVFSPKSRNLLQNSSFESGDSTGWYFHCSNTADRNFGQKIEVCDTDPWDGKYCLHMYSTNPAGAASNFQLTGKGTSYNPNKKYVVSVYAKGDVYSVAIQYWTEKDLVSSDVFVVNRDLGREWVRLVYVSGEKRPTATLMRVVVRVLSPGKEAYLDALQLEEGVEATEYTPSGDFPVPPKKQRRGQFF